MTFAELISETLRRRRQTQHAFIVPDKFSLAKKMLALVVLVCTLGFIGLVENLIIIGEATEPSATPAGAGTRSAVAVG